MESDKELLERLGKEAYLKAITEPFAEKWRKLGWYLGREMKKGNREFRISFHDEQQFIIHPFGKDGDTLDLSI